MITVSAQSKSSAFTGDIIEKIPTRFPHPFGVFAIFADCSSATRQTIVVQFFVVGRILSAMYCVSFGPGFRLNDICTADGYRLRPSEKNLGIEPARSTFPASSFVSGTSPVLYIVIERHACCRKNFCPSLSGIYFEIVFGSG